MKTQVGHVDSWDLGAATKKLLVFIPLIALGAKMITIITCDDHDDELDYDFILQLNPHPYVLYDSGIGGWYDILEGSHI